MGLQQEQVNSLDCKVIIAYHRNGGDDTKLIHIRKGKNRRNEKIADYGKRGKPSCIVINGQVIYLKQGD